MRPGDRACRARPRIAAAPDGPGPETTIVPGAGAPSAGSPPALSNHLWVALMQRSFGLGLLAHPRCGSQLRLIAPFDEAAVVRWILRHHLGSPTEVPLPRPRRAPPAAELPTGDSPRVTWTCLAQHRPLQHRP